MINPLYFCFALQLSLPMEEGNRACKFVSSVLRQQKKVDPFVFSALIHEESRWKIRAVSKAGACGLAQILPKYTYPKKSCRQLMNPYVNIRVSAKMLKNWINNYGRGEYAIGLCGYAIGKRCRGKDTKIKKRGQRYAKRIMSLSLMIRNYYKLFLAKERVNN